MNHIQYYLWCVETVDRENTVEPEDIREFLQ